MTQDWPPPPVAPVLGRIDAYLDHWAALRGDDEFLIDGGPVLTGRRMSWHQARREVDGVAAALAAAGLQRGDRVSYLADSRLDFFVHFLAASSIGLVWQGLSPKHTWNELSYVVGDFRPRVVFDARLGDTTSDDLVARLVAGTPNVERGVVVDSPDWVDLLSNGEVLGPEVLDRRRSEVEPMDPAFIVYTSGTTGRPKGALLTHRGVCYCGVSGVTARGGPDLRIICNLPVNHIGAISDICCRKMVGGGSIVFQERFDAGLMLATITAERVAMWGGVPTMFQMCADHPDFDTTDLSSIRQIQWGGAPMPAPVLSRLLERVNAERCVTGYGMTETTGGVTAMPPDATADQIVTTVGRPIPGHEIRIADDGREVAVGQSGEVQVRGDWTMAGYWNRPEATARVIDAEGWLSTGDLGLIRPDGHLQLVGRLSEMFKTGGYNAYPREIEMCLEDHPAVRMAAVVAVPDAMFDEVGHAFVVADADTDPEDLRDHCRERLANYKVPKAVHLRTALPMLAIGKVDKKALRSEAVDLAGR